MPAKKTAKKELSPVVKDRIRRLKWWNEARFGMFLHWGMSSVLGRNEWVYDDEGLSWQEYEANAKKFKPNPDAPREWAALAKRAGMKYIYLTAKHHDGFCMFDTKTTNYSVAAQAGVDMVRQFVDACRDEGLRPGFYYSPMDWHHPDGCRCAKSEAALVRYRSYIHEQVRELFTNYGPIALLWYDGAGPINAKQWQIRKLNNMIRKLQPDIIINHRMFLQEDYDTGEAMVGYSGREASKANDGRGWETSTCINTNWGYHKNDHQWKTPWDICFQLAGSAHNNGNYTVNIGPGPDGSFHPEEHNILNKVGEWMDKNGESIYGTEASGWWGAVDVQFTQKGKTVYAHIYAWPGETFGISALNRKVLRASFLCNGKPVKFDQDKIRLRFHDMPKQAPDDPVTVIKLELDGKPTVQRDREVTRNLKPRGPVWLPE